MEQDLILGEKCEKCGGPIMATPYVEVTFLEKSFDYIHRSVWICHFCGHGNSLYSEPQYHY